MSKKAEVKPLQKTFPVNIFKHGVKVFFGTYDELKKSLKRDGFDGDYKEEKELMDKSAGITFTIPTNDVIIWMREKPKDNGELSVLAHEVFHAVSFLLRSIGIDHTPDTEEVYAYTFEYLYSDITSWACS